jgi:hypothetical protein
VKSVSGPTGIRPVCGRDSLNTTSFDAIAIKLFDNVPESLETATGDIVIQLRDGLFMNTGHTKIKFMAGK